MKKFETEVLEKLREIQEIIDGALRRKGDFTVKTTSAAGNTYTYDRENYLQCVMELVSDPLQSVIEEIEERSDRKRSFAIFK